MQVLGSAQLGRDTKKKARTGRLALLGALGVLTASVLVLPGQATAAVRCDAPQGQSCLGIKNSNPVVGSVRVGVSPVSNVGQGDLAVPRIKVAATSASGNPAVVVYNDSNCERTFTGGGVGISWASKADSNNFRWVYIVYGGVAG